MFCCFMLSVTLFLIAEQAINYKTVGHLVKTQKWKDSFSNSIQNKTENVVKTQ